MRNVGSGGGTTVITKVVQTASIWVSESDGDPREQCGEIEFDIATPTGGFTLTVAAGVAQIGLQPIHLLLDGTRPMQADLDMDDGNGPWSIFDLKNLTFSGGVGAAIVNLVRTITMTGVGLIQAVRKLDFTGSAVGEGIVDQPRVIHMDGVEADSEGRVDGLEGIIYNATTTVGYARNQGRIEWQTGVTPGTDYTKTIGFQSWDDVERTMVVYVESGA